MKAAAFLTRASVPIASLAIDEFSVEPPASNSNSVYQYVASSAHGHPEQGLGPAARSQEVATCLSCSTLTRMHAILIRLGFCSLEP